MLRTFAMRLGRIIGSNIVPSFVTFLVRETLGVSESGSLPDHGKTVPSLECIMPPNLGIVTAVVTLAAALVQSTSAVDIVMIGGIGL